MSVTLSTPTRTVDGVGLPTPGTYALDSAHTHAGFVVRHMTVAKVRGEFGAVAGSVVVADDLADSTLEVRIDAASIATRDEGRDQHLKSADFLDVANHPAIEFVGTGVVARGDGRWDVAGDLTIRGVTRPVVLDTEFAGVLVDPWGNERFGITATAEIDREEFGLTWNQPLAKGGVLVGRKVRIEIEAELVRPLA